jgi:hypothetical protein
MIMGTSGEHVIGNSPVYSFGGCDCGCAPEFQFYYDGKKLAILPCSFVLNKLNWNLTHKNRKKLLTDVRSQLGIKRAYLIRKGEEPPEFLKQYLRQ